MKGVAMRTAGVWMVVLGVLSACMAGCAATGSASGSSPVGSWVLSEMEGRPVEIPAGALTPTLVIERGGSISGLAGINHYSGSLREGPDRGRFDLGPLAVTRMAGPPEAMRLETMYLTLLNAADAWKFDGRILVLTGPGGVELRFEPGADEVG